MNNLCLIPFYFGFYMSDIVKMFKTLHGNFSICVFQNTFGCIPEIFHKIFYRIIFKVYLLHKVFSITFEKNNASFSYLLYLKESLFKYINLIFF